MPCRTVLPARTAVKSDGQWHTAQLRGVRLAAGDSGPTSIWRGQLGEGDNPTILHVFS